MKPLARILHTAALLLSLAGLGAWAAMNLPLDDSAPLSLPKVGDHQLRLFSSNVVELLLITTKAPDPAPVTQWNFVDANGNFTPPALSEFAVTANGQSVAVQSVGFKRRVLYADLQTYDLRIANYLYLRLARSLAAGTLLQVRNPSGNLWATNVLFTLTVDPLRYSPAIHVNQVGYLPTFPKKGIIGYYLGNLGELPVASAPGFQLISTQTSNVVYQGMLVLRPDVGYHYTPAPYQQVLEADFSAFQTPGQYKLVVPSLGASLPFLIDDRVGGSFARAYELGIYHQRCGTSNALPFTRFVHGPCHTNKAQVPTLASPEFDFANSILN
ncbi:MAG TPA: cellulase N-terminal Ig-like domain-containing protein, partial [Bacillota bacterium]|nr:cellulase N-terminal Ig-like domain-containing protein [Bacillota bacterium]